MERYKRFLLVAASLTLVLALVTMLSTKEVHALVATMVQVVNDAAHPVPTVATDNPARTAVVLSAEGDIPDGASSTGFIPFSDIHGIYTVPAGKRLVIESVSVAFSLPSGQKPDLVEVQTGPFSPPFFPVFEVVPVFLATDGSKDRYNVGTEFKAYVDSGFSPAGFCDRNSTTGDSGCSWTVYGHLESIQ